MIPLWMTAMRPDWSVWGWAFVVVGVGPVLLYGGGVDVLLVPLALTAVAAGVYLVWLLFRASTEVHGPRVHLRKPESGDGPQKS